MSVLRARTWRDEGVEEREVGKVKPRIWRTTVWMGVGWRGRVAALG